METAHIEAWALSRTHHHGNLVRVCSGCHVEHDRHKSLPTPELREIKDAAVARTRAELAREMGLAANRFSPPASETMFVGRAQQLDELCEGLGKGGAVLLLGPGGIGKTELLLKALERRPVSGRVVWLDVDGHESAEDIATALAMSTAELEPGESLDGVAGALDAQGCCVVLDGVERLAEAGLDEVDDLLADLRKGMRKAQLVVTSQVDLPRTVFDRKFALSGLDAGSSRRLLRSLVRGDARLDRPSEARLLDFAEGHPLALRLIAALVEYLGSGSIAVREIEREGARVVEIPRRADRNRRTSLERCLSLAYRMLSPEEQRLLFVVASCPGGVTAHQVQHYGGPGTAMLVAGLRRWSLVQRRDVGIPIDRWYALSPIRSFARWRWQEANETEARELTDEMLRDFGLMAGVIEQQGQDALDVPHMVGRFWREWRNLILVVEEAEARPEDADLAMLASLVCSSMVRFFFVARLPERGVRMVIRGAQISMRAQNWKDASAYIVEVAGLAQRCDDDQLARAVGELLEAMPADGGDAGHVAMARAILANIRRDAVETEKEARKAIGHYEGERDRLYRMGDGGDEDELVAKRNNLSGAYQMLGHALLARGWPKEAREAYESALELVGGASRAVNEGQIVYQIGRCLGEAGQHSESAGYYARASVHFGAVGMRDYLANALGALGYALLELGDSSAFPPALPREVLLDGIGDAVESIRRSTAVVVRKGTADTEWAIRKVFGTVVVLSLFAEEECLGEAGRAVMAWTKELREAGEIAQLAGFEILHSEALAELMLSIARIADRAKPLGSVRESDVEELVERCKSLGILPGLESSGFEWLRVYLWRRWSVSDDGNGREP